jgi:hypothetical protein
VTPISDTLPDTIGAITGVANTSGQNMTINYTGTFTGFESVPLSASFEIINGVRTIEVNLTNAVLEVQDTTYNGQAAQQVFVDYFPTKESGTFVVADATGTLLSGNPVLLESLQQDIVSGDPEAFSVADAVLSKYPVSFFEHFSSPFADMRCGMFLAVDALDFIASWETFGVAAIAMEPLSVDTGVSCGVAYML